MDATLDVIRNETDFSGQNLAGIDFSYCDLENANFAGCNLMDAIFIRARLNSANFAGAKLDGANLQSAHLESAILTRASLKRANLQGAIFRNARLKLANLEHSTLRRANLTSANLRDCNLHGADLTNSKTLGANFIGMWGTGVIGYVCLGYDTHGCHYRAVLMFGEWQITTQYDSYTVAEAREKFFGNADVLARLQILDAHPTPQKSLPEGIRGVSDWRFRVGNHQASAA